MTIKELIKQLFDRRRTLIEQERELFAQIEARPEGEETGQDREKHARLGQEIGELGRRIEGLLVQEEHNKQAEEQREQFERLIKPQGGPDPDKDLEERIRTWMRAGLPDAEVWAPRAITVQLESHDLVKGTPAAGGDLVPTGFVRRLYEHLVEMAAVRQTNAQVIQTDSGENMLVPATTGHGTAGIVAEAGPLVENDPAFKQVELAAFKYGQLIQVSRELIEDAAVDLLGYLARAAGLAIGQANGAHLVTGTGTGQPQGVANAATAGVTGTTGSATSVTAENLIDLYHSVISGYRARAYWLMNDLTAAFVRKIREGSGSTAGNFIWQPGLQAGVPDTILGRPVVTDPGVAAMAANAFSIAFGDFSLYYAIRDVRAVRFERSDDFAFANDLVSFRSIFRTDARQLVNGANGAVKWYRNSAT